MKRQNFFIIFIFIVGLGLMLYPLISNFFMNNSHASLIEEYDHIVEDLTTEEKDEMKSEAISYNENAVSETLYAADPFEDVNAAGTENSGYYDLMDVGEEIATIEIPKLNIEYPIFHGTSEEVLHKGIGHLSNSSLPVGGDSTHAILAGHRGMPSADMFLYLDQVEIGDHVFIHVLDEVLAYEVYAIDVVLPYDTGSLVIEEGRDLLTLVTCEPYMINTHRLLVKAERIPFVTEQAEEEHIRQPHEKPNKVKVHFKDVAIILAVMLFVVLFIVLLLKSRKKGRSR